MWRKQHPYAGAVRIDFNTSEVVLPEGCNSEAFVQVIFTIDAARAPSNHMTSSGREGFNSENLDLHEFGGHVILENAVPTTASKDISLPFVTIIRQASDLTLTNPTPLDLNTDGVTDVQVDLVNRGAETAQVDVFQLLAFSGDDAESSFGQLIVPNDLRYMGYRVLEAGQAG